ncbi:MAG TPA: polymer-forming cytoskeletal protein [Gemmatimonadaceae bacterium]|nr:polymer-forming cytoskeletal protein [Gemmatimonadaceae bacterium]
MRRVSFWLFIVLAVLIPGRASSQSGRVVGPNVTTSGSVVAYKGDLNIYGTVRGDATALRGNVIVHRGGRVTGNATAVRGRVRIQGGVVNGRVSSVARDVRTVTSRRVVVHRNDTGRTVGLAVGWMLVVAITGFAILAFGSDKLAIVVSTMQDGVGKSLWSGILGQLAIVPGAIAVVVLLAATIIGILLIPLGLIAFMFAVAGIAMFGFVAVATMTGAAITGNDKDATPHGAMLRAFFTGTAVYLGLWIVAALFSGVPLLGAMLASFASAVTFIAITTGFGAVLRSYWRGEFKKRALPVGDTI